MRAAAPDQPLEEREEMEFDNEGDLIERPKRERKPRGEKRDEAATEGKTPSENAEAEADTKAEAKA